MVNTIFQTMETHVYLDMLLLLILLDIKNKVVLSVQNGESGWGNSRSWSVLRKMTVICEIWIWQAYSTSAADNTTWCKFLNFVQWSRLCLRISWCVCLRYRYDLQLLSVPVVLTNMMHINGPLVSYHLYCIATLSLG